MSLALEAWSLNHWTAREVPHFGFLKSVCLTQNINAYIQGKKDAKKYTNSFSLGDGITNDIFYFLLISIF